jgi:hypothetical protein
VLLDEEQIIQYGDRSFIENVHWWERTRWVYNLVVLVSGSIPIYNRTELLNDFDVITIIVIYGFLANICYCLGWGIDLLGAHYFNYRFNGQVTRMLLLVLGTVGSFLLTLLLSFLLSSSLVPF